MSTFSEALRLYQEGRYDEAARRLRILLEFDRENAQAWMYYGAALGQLGRWSQAADAYRQVVDLEPEEASSYVDLATALVECGRLEQAGNALQAAIELEPRHPVALEMRERLGTTTAPPPSPARPAAQPET
ncbi:MAG: tetratricopeptide repeat protein, partial [Armatimonadetes bacterium]|nr:tetratricopeptide repeat protein [Armatimonadota bacterium]